MASDALTDDQRELLMRWFDGELEADQAERARQLVDDRRVARDFVEALEQVRAATTAAVDQARPARAELSATETIVEHARQAPPAEALSLERLAPLLERYHDGEVTEPERRSVERLADRRDDVAEYLDGLRSLGEAARAAHEAAAGSTDPDALRSEIDPELAHADHPDDPPAYEPNRDRELLHRYVDGELSDRRRRLVETWLRDEGGEAARTVEALEQLGDAVRHADAHATDKADLGSIRAAVDRRIDGLASEEDGPDEGAEVVSLQTSRRDGGHTDGPREETAAEPTDRPSADRGTAGWFPDYRQGLIGAAAAALLAVAAGVAFGPDLFDDEQVVVKEKKTVVIVDSVQYSDGSSVVVDSPMQKVSASGDDNAGSEGAAGSEEDDSTVIWLLDNGKGTDGPGGESGGSSDDSAAPGFDETDDSRDAGHPEGSTPPDTGRPRGQPI